MTNALPNPFSGDNAVAYYLPGTSGWGPLYAGIPTVPWDAQVQVAGGAAGANANGFRFNITASTNVPIVIEAASSPSGTQWTVLQSCTVTNGSIQFADPQWTNYPARFYRVRWP